MTGQSLSKIILIFQGHLQGKRLISRSDQKHHSQQIKLGTCVIALIHGISTEKYNNDFILVIQGHL